MRFRDHILTAADEEGLTRYRREHVGFVFQFYNLIASLTAEENVALVTEIARDPMSPAKALALVGLKDRATGEQVAVSLDGAVDAVMAALG